MAAVLVISVVALLATAMTVVVCGSSPVTTLTLERAFPTNHGVELSQLRARDLLRHRRMLQQSSNGVVDFSVEGTFDPFQVG